MCLRVGRVCVREGRVCVREERVCVREGRAMYVWRSARNEEHLPQRACLAARRVCVCVCVCV